MLTTSVSVQAEVVNGRRTDVPPAISVILPTRNEAGNVRPLLERLSAALDGIAGEVIFVDDSADDTPAAVRAAGGETPLAVLLVARPPEQRNGLSGAVVDGMRVARGHWVCVMDADLQHPPALLPQLLRRATETGADIVVGSRLANLGGPVGLSRLRSLTSQSLTLLARALFPRLLGNVSDPLTGLFLVRREAVDPEVMRPDGFKILMEILVRCPELRVSEIHFEFGARHTGQSKADLNEGIRFFRHLLRLRFTANEHFSRFLIVGVTGLLANSMLLAALVAMARLHYLGAAVLATQGSAAWNFFLTERWVFGERRQSLPAWHRLLRFLLMNNVLLLLHLPMMYLLVSLTGVHYLAANLVAIFVTTLVRYVTSDQWIWTTGLIGRRPLLFRYDIHGLVTIESVVRLPELQYFLVGQAMERTDIRVLADRQGTPRCMPGAICYDEGLGRYGFGVTVLPGDYSEIVVSPLLRRAPHLLYRRVVEPLIRWRLAHRGYALVAGGCLEQDGRATLYLTSRASGGQALMLKLAGREDAGFMAAESVIAGPDGRVHSYPLPLAIGPAGRAAMKRVGFGRRERAAATVAGWLYGAAHGWPAAVLDRLGLPVASLQAMFQALVEPPLYMAHHLMRDVRYCDVAILAAVVGPDGQSRGQHDPAGWTGQDSRRFRPDMEAALARWEGEEWRAAEQAVMRRLLERHGAAPAAEVAVSSFTRATL